MKTELTIDFFVISLFLIILIVVNIKRWRRNKRLSKRNKKSNLKIRQKKFQNYDKDDLKRKKREDEAGINQAIQV